MIDFNSREITIPGISYCIPSLQLTFAFRFHISKVHKYGKSTTGESWDIVVDEETYYEYELAHSV